MPDVTLPHSSLGMAVAEQPFQLFRQAMARFDAVSLDRTTIRQESLDIQDKKRSNLFPWRGQFSPQLIECLLRHFGRNRSHLLDPFAGVGTALIESARHGIAATGIEINPAAITMATSIEFMPLSLGQRQAYFVKARRLLAECSDGTPPLFACDTVDQVQSNHVRRLADLTTRHEHHPLIHSLLANTLVRILELPTPQSETSLFAAFNQHIRAIEALPQCKTPCRVVHCDARDLPLPDESVDIVITSPPYINVFNYHQNNRKAMELLGWDLLRVAKSEFGANRKNRANRFLTVVQYCLDIYGVMIELRRVLSKDGLVILVVGRESSVRGVAFRNGHIVSTIATMCGFDLSRRQERKFVNKFGSVIVEDILHLTKAGGVLAFDERAAAMAAKALLQQVTPQSDEIAMNISDAIDQADHVCASPIFKSPTARVFSSAV